MFRWSRDMTVTRYDQDFGPGETPRVSPGPGPRSIPDSVNLSVIERIDDVTCIVLQSYICFHKTFKPKGGMDQFLNLLLLLGTLQFNTASISIYQMIFILFFPVNLKIVSDIIFTFQTCLLHSKRNLDQKAVKLVSN